MNSFSRILIVDDSPLDTEMILQALIDNEVCRQAVHVRDGVEALDFIYCQGPYAGRTPVQSELVFLDLHMPKMDGMEVLRQIRSDDRFNAMPVVMFTTARDGQVVAGTRELGVNLLVEKPVDYDEYLGVVKSVVDRMLNVRS